MLLEQHETRLDLLHSAERQFLQAFASGPPFGDICAHCEQSATAIDVTVMLPLWVQQGWVTGFTLDSSKTIVNS